MNKLMLVLVAVFGLTAGAIAAEKAMPTEAPAVDSSAMMEDCSKMTDATAKKACEEKNAAAAEANKTAPAK